jgi:CHASE2 domain-containing sensor protein
MNRQRRLAALWQSAGQVLQRTLLATLPLLVFVLHAAGIAPLEFVQRIENYLYDVRVQWMMPRVVDPRVVIVDIDEASLAAEGQWPWPRRKIAALNDALFDGYGIRALGFDVLFAADQNRVRPPRWRFRQCRRARQLCAAGGDRCVGVRAAAADKPHRHFSDPAALPAAA